MKGRIDMQTVSLTITVPRDTAMNVLKMLGTTTTEISDQVGAMVAATPRRGRPPKNAAPSVSEAPETTDEDETLFTETSSDDAPEAEAEEEEAQTMTIEELQAGLRKLGNPKAIIAMMEKRFKVRSIAKLDPSQYEACLKAARSLK